MSTLPAPRHARWALEDAANPTVLRLHVDTPLTDETIVTVPPADAAEPVRRLLEIEAIRSLDLHRYRVRLNLRPGADRSDASGHATEVLTAAWGAPASLPADAGPRAFAFPTAGDRARRVAESPAMAAGTPPLEAVFAVDGVSEAVLGDGLVLVRLGRLFAWAEAEGPVAAALQDVTAAGTPGSISPPS